MSAYYSPGAKWKRQSSPSPPPLDDPSFPSDGLGPSLPGPIRSRTVRGFLPAPDLVLGASDKAYVRAADNLHEDDVARLREAARKRGTLAAKLQSQLTTPELQRDPSAFADAMLLSGVVEQLAWMLHRLGKLLEEARIHIAGGG